MAYRNKQDAFNYANNYSREHYDKVLALLPQGEKEHLKKVCKEKGYRSVNEFINACISEKLKRLNMEYIKEDV